MQWIEIEHPIIIVLSILFVLLGFFIDAKAWHTIVKSEVPGVLFKDSIISSGKYILTKYVPGKLWIIIGKAGYINEKYNNSLINLTSLSLFYQVISIIVSFIMGLAILYIINEFLFWAVLILLSFIFLISCLFYRVMIENLSLLLSKIFKQEIKIPFLSKKTIKNVFSFSLLNWFIWSASFYLFLISFNAYNGIPAIAGFIFPVSSIIGILVLISPGGIGVRESIISLGLILLGESPERAASIAVLSRFWFLTGEVLFFLIAVIYSLKRDKNDSEVNHN